MKTTERSAAIELRRNGETYAQIRQKLRVSKGSLSRWLSDVPFVTSSESLQRKRTSALAGARVMHQRKLDRISKIMQEASKNLPVASPEILDLLGVVAYWAEGSKTQDNLVAFTNTDPVLIRLVLKWLIECCKVDPRRLRLHVRVHSDTAIREAERFWREVTGIPVSQCYKTTIKESGSGGRRVRKLRHGIATIKVCDTNLHYWIRGRTEALIRSLQISIAPVAQLDRAEGF